ncbi:hypothetical protein [Rhizobium sp.]|uniref:hypothetical protein n=1 Tax=Rhizobium sp. TaxID=391 RepID=UPI002AA7F8F6
MAIKSEEINTPIRPKDTWRVGRIVIGGFLGFACAAMGRAFDFWNDDSATTLHAILGFLGVPLLLLVTVIMLLAYLVAAFISLCRCRFRRMSSSLVAIVFVPLCFVTISRVPIFDPWLWYVIFNKSTLEAEAAAKGNTEPASQQSTTIEERDVTFGLALGGNNHFIDLIYSKNNLDGQTTDNSSTTHIYGNFYRRDTFM